MAKHAAKAQKPTKEQRKAIRALNQIMKSNPDSFEAVMEALAFHEWGAGKHSYDAPITKHIFADALVSFDVTGASSDFARALKQEISLRIGETVEFLADIYGVKITYPIIDVMAQVKEKA